MTKLYLQWNGSLEDEHKDFEFDLMQYEEVEVNTSLASAVEGSDVDTIIIEVEVVRTHTIRTTSKPEVLKEYSKVKPTTKKKGAK